MARQVHRLCDLCRRPCVYVDDDHPVAPGEARYRWACPEHGGRPSPVLVRR